MLLDCRLAKKDYLQINAFLPSGDRVEKNLKILLIKATKSLSSGARRKILNFINKSLDRIHNIVVRD